MSVRNVHPQLQHRSSIALRTFWQLCLLVPEVGCPRWPAGLPSVRRSFSVSDGACDRPPTLPPDMVGLFQGVQVGWIWRPLVFGNEIWAVGLEPVLHGTSCVCWCAVLLEDASTGQSKFINKELPALLFTNTTSQINGKLVTDYFESLKESWTIFMHRFSYKVFERAEIARCQHCNADNFKIL